MSTNYALLERQMHTLTTGEIRELRRIADTVFEPLTRPFRQKRTVPEFDYHRTIKRAQKIGHLLPTYSRKEREHRKSRLVIAMSLSGIDRCSAVSLIPLFGELRKFLDFKLFIYTSDLIPARFTHDGFLENDHEISWNNVAGPVIFARLDEMHFTKQEDTLLLIDSLGGGDSQWYWHWTRDNAREAREEQKKYLVEEGEWGGYWSKMRRMIGGDYDSLATLPKSSLPPAWEKTIKRNCQDRWVDSPALQDYLVRWLFHPEFGRRHHGDWFPRIRRYYSDYCDVGDILPKLATKFKRVHLLSPNYNDDTESVLHRLLEMNVIDYYHKADTIEGLAHTLANIVHGRCTDKLTYEKPLFKEYIDTDEETEPDSEGDDDHDELTQTKEDCFKGCDPVDPWIPEKTKYEVPLRKRGEYVVSTNEVAYNRCDVGEWFPTSYNTGGWDQMMGNVPPLQIDPFASKFTHLQAIETFLEAVKKHQIVACKNYSEPRLRRIERERQLKCSPEFREHRTRALEQHFQDFLELLAPVYQPYVDALPLQNVVWCSSGKFRTQKLSIGVEPEPRESWASTTFHESGHWLEHICPEVGAFTNHLLRMKVGRIQQQKLINVMPGEKAMPVTDGSTPWIIPYAGKWYKRHHFDLPNPTEILSVHVEYFRSPESLLTLAKHDLFLVKFIAFIAMGGPIAAFEATREAKEVRVLDQINQRNRASYGYTRRSGGTGRRSYRSGSTYTPKKKSKRFGV